MSWPQVSLAAPVTIDQQTNQICTYIDMVFAQPRGGEVKAMESMWHMWEYILSATDTPTVLVCCTGENPRGSFSEQDQWARVDRQWTIVVLYGHGFRNLLRDEKGVPARKEVLTNCIEALRDAVRSMTGISEEYPVNYRGWKNLPAMARPGTANVFVAGAELNFSTANDIGEVRAQE